jgi:DNA-binding IclR family transcriptional regulator
MPTADSPKPTPAAPSPAGNPSAPSAAPASGRSEAAEAQENPQRAVQSVEVGGRLLLALTGVPGPLPLKELAARAGLTPARAHPYLVSFAKLGLIEQIRPSGLYALGPAALELGLTALSQLDPLRVAGPVAEALAERTGFAVALAVWGNLGPTVVRMIEARQPLLVAMRAGTVMSPLSTATGRAFSAVSPLERVLRAAPGALGEDLVSPAGLLAWATSGAAGPRALSAAEAEILRAAQADIQQHGLVRAEGRPIPGVNAFSAPAFDHQGRAALVITALGHQDHFPIAWDSPVAHDVRAAASRISQALGWTGPAVLPAASPQTA